MSEVFPSISFLIPELKVGNQKAWNDLCDSFRDGMIAKTRKFLQSARIEKQYSPDDLVQETFLKAWRSRESFQGVSTSQFASWLLIILRNSYIDLVRKKNLEFSTPTEFELVDSQDSPSGQMQSTEQEAVLHASLAELDSRSREILILRHFENLKFHEIAERSGMNINTAATICRRAILRLGELMELNEDQNLSRD